MMTALQLTQEASTRYLSLQLPQFHPISGIDVKTQGFFLYELSGPGGARGSAMIEISTASGVKVWRNEMTLVLQQ